jgi:hypothetical protein
MEVVYVQVDFVEVASAASSASDMSAQSHVSHTDPVMGTYKYHSHVKTLPFARWY